MAALADEMPSMPMSPAPGFWWLPAGTGCGIACGPGAIVLLLLHSLWIWGDRAGNYRVFPELGRQDISACSRWSVAADVHSVYNSIQLEGQESAKCHSSLQQTSLPVKFVS